MATVATSPRHDVNKAPKATNLPGAHEEVLDPSKEIRVRLLWKVDQLQMLPSLAMRAIELTNDPDCSITEFVNITNKDVTLAADMLKMANSMVYSRGVPIANLQQAVVRLGFRQCKNLILASSANSLMMQLTTKETWLREALWRHGFLTASIASFLNRAMNLGFQGEEFTAGLIHDIGRILLAVLDPSGFSKADKFDFQESGEDVQSEMLARERSLLGTDHCAIGSWYVEYSGLPKSLADVIRKHHAPVDQLTQFPLVALIAVSDHMANHMQLTKCPAGYVPELNSAITVLAPSESSRKRLTEIIPIVMEDAVTNLALL